ncbi:MAG: galactokinase [Firmicutes bacterium HGW-Firmicutes-10]|nr:MAG: galactokinase [Firmicutes bacterium HGW-Firmicutes-10]
MNINAIKESINNGKLDDIFRKLTVIDQQSFSRSRWLMLIDEFSRYFSETDIFGFSAPGRSEIGGNHTDHQWGRVLAAAVNLDTIAVVAKNNSSLINIRSKGFDIKAVDIKKLSVCDDEKHTSEALIRGVCAGFAEKGYAIGGFNAVMDSQVLPGSGISSSAAFEVLLGQILSDLFNDSMVDHKTIALVGQYAENEYFKKPCGLMDQMTSAVGGVVFIDFNEPNQPVVEQVDFDLNKAGYALCLVNTGGSHENLSDAYAKMPQEMKDVARYFNQPVLSKITMKQFLEHLPQIREHCSDRACLRAYHFFRETDRVIEQKNALINNDLSTFLRLIITSGQSSYMYLQNVYMPEDIEFQPIAVALALSQHILIDGGYRVHGGGLAGTIQAFVKLEQVFEFTTAMEHVFGVGCTFDLAIRSIGSVQVF